jgi:serine/threonine protein kinase
VSPEIIAGNSEEITWATDIWSFGCTIYELLTGSPPWGKLEPVKALYKIHTEPMPLLPYNQQFSEDIQSLISLCCQSNRLSRPTAKQLLTHAWFRKEIDIPQKGLIRCKTAQDLKAILDSQQEELSTSTEGAERRHRHTTLLIDVNSRPGTGYSRSASLVPSLLESIDEDEQNSHLEACQLLVNRLQFRKSEIQEELNFDDPKPEYETLVAEQNAHLEVIIRILPFLKQFDFDLMWIFINLF